MERLRRMVLFSNKMEMTDHFLSNVEGECVFFKIWSCHRLHAITASQDILSHMDFLFPPLPSQADSVSRTHMAAHFLHLLWIYCCLATAAAAAPCLPALVPTLFDQEHCAWLLGQGPGWGLNLCPPGLVLFWYNSKVRQFAVHSWSPFRPIETKWHRQCDAFSITRFL